ncbi:MAG: DUF4290 domain-containing protein [Crocinitomicaceae bacterium]|nr:DUF4290 domain-containing protein [Crocinitomicaceae bacterium]
MEYNTARPKMLLPEYGRNVQNMIAHAMDIEGRDERNRAAQAIIEVMGQLNPHLRDVDDYRHKLWTHLFVMSDFELDVDSPYELPEKEELEEKPELMTYPKNKIRYGHYGQYTQKMIDTTKEITDEKEMAYMTSVMGNFMKKQYLVHNNNAVENQSIADQLKQLSDGRLEMENPDDELTGTNAMLKLLGVKQNQSQNQKRSGGSNNNNNRRKQQQQKKKFKR